MAAVVHGEDYASRMASSSTVAAWFLAIAHFGATVAGQSVMVLRPCSTSQCWLSTPMWNLNFQLRRIARQKWRQQRPRICSVRHEQRWLPSFMARTTYGMFLPLRFSTMTVTVVSRYRPLWRNRCRPVSHGPPPLLYQPVLVKYPYVEPELSAEAHRPPKMAAAKAEDMQRATRAKVAAVVHGEDYIRHVFTATVLHYDSHSIYVNDQISDEFQLS